MFTFAMFFVCVLSFIVWYFVKKGGLTVEDKTFISGGKSTRRISLIVALLALALTLKPFHIVPTGSKGLLFTMGAIENVELNPGLQFKVPVFQIIEDYTVQPIQLAHEISVDANGAITQDNQTIGAMLTVFYLYNPNELVRMYRDFGVEKIKDITLTSLVESFKTEIGRHDIFVLPTIQDSIQREVFSGLRSKMSGYPITISELKITNYDWSDAFDAQISATMERAQQVKQKQQELLIAEQEAQKEVKKAEAAKTSEITKAEGEKQAAILRAEAKAAEGEGIRKYNEAVQKNMELELKIRTLDIERIKAERWNGQYVPTNNYGPIPVQTGQLQPSGK